MELGRLRGMLKVGLAVKLAACVALAVLGWTIMSGEPGQVAAQSAPQPAAAPPSQPAASPPADTARPDAAEKGRSDQAVPTEAAPAQATLDPRVVKLIEERQAELNQQAVMLERERQELEKLKKDVVTRIDELKKVQKVLEQLVAEEQAQRQARIAQLVKVLGNMKADAAAAVVSRLDDQMAVEIFSRMQSRIAGQVMANLDPAQAARISVLLTKQQQSNQAAATAKEATGKP